MDAAMAFEFLPKFKTCISVISSADVDDVCVEGQQHCVLEGLPACHAYRPVRAHDDGEALRSGYGHVEPMLVQNKCDSTILVGAEDVHVFLILNTNLLISLEATADRNDDDSCFLPLELVYRSDPQRSSKAWMELGLQLSHLKVVRRHNNNICYS